MEAVRGIANPSCAIARLSTCRSLDRATR